MDAGIGMFDCLVGASVGVRGGRLVVDPDHNEEIGLAQGSDGDVSYCLVFIYSMLLLIIYIILYMFSRISLPAFLCLSFVKIATFAYYFTVSVELCNKLPQLIS